MGRSISERRLVDVLVSYLRPSHTVARELEHYEKRIDVYALCGESAELWAIEAKSENWARALAQAIVNLAAAERSYIAIYSGHAHRVSRVALEEHGIGLISVGGGWGEVEILLEARPSPYTNRLAVRRLRDRLAEVQT